MLQLSRLKSYYLKSSEEFDTAVRLCEVCLRKAAKQPYMQTWAGHVTPLLNVVTPNQLLTLVTWGIQHKYWGDESVTPKLLQGCLKELRSDYATQTGDSSILIDRPVQAVADWFARRFMGCTTGVSLRDHPLAYLASTRAWDNAQMYMTEANLTLGQVFAAVSEVIREYYSFRCETADWKLLSDYELWDTMLPIWMRNAYPDVECGQLKLKRYVH